MQALTADGTREHLHRCPIAQLTDPNSSQSIGATGEQALVPVIQRGQGEGRIQAAGGFQQHIQQAFHLGAGGRLLPSQGKAQTARD